MPYKRRKTVQSLKTASALQNIRNYEAARKKAVTVKNQGIPRAPASKAYVLQPRSEIKIKDNFNIASAIDAVNPRVVDLCEIASGAGVDQRIGNKITPTGFQCYINLVGTKYGEPVVETVKDFNAPWSARVVLLQDMTLQTTLPDVKLYFNDLLNSGNADEQLIYMPKNWQRQSTFRVLHDEIVSLSQQPQTNSNIAWHFYVKPKGGMKQVMYQDTTATLSKNMGGRVFLLVFTNCPATSEIYCTSSIRMYYKDS